MKEIGKKDLRVQNIDAVSDEGFLSVALDQAKKAATLGEVPIGAVIVHENKIIARAHNRREIDHDPLAHAELLAIKKASKKLKRWRLQGCTMYITLEPCPMCAGAIVNSRVDRVVFGAHDPKGGAVNSLYEILSDKRLNHRPHIKHGVLMDDCSRILKEFFSSLRQNRRQSRRDSRS